MQTCDVMTNAYELYDINANNINRIYENVFELFMAAPAIWQRQEACLDAHTHTCIAHIHRHRGKWNGDTVCERAQKKKRNGTKTKLQEYSLGCCAITYSNPTEFIVQYFMTTNDFRFVKRDDP